MFAPSTTDLSRLHGQLGQRKTHTCSDVDDDLLRDGIVDCAAEDVVPTEEAREEGIVLALFAVGRRVPQEEHCGFVDEGEEAEVAGVLAGCFVDEEAF